MKVFVQQMLRLLIVVVLGVSLLGWYASRGGAQEPVTIKVALEEGRMANVGRFVAAEYAKTHPNVKIEIVGLPDTSMPEKLNVTLTSGQYVYDAIEFFPSLGPGFVKNGWVRPLDQWWNEKDPYFSDFLLVNIVSKYTGAPPKWAGTYYGLPFSSDVKMLVYRKDLYEANSLKPPKTWEEFVKNCLALQDRSKGFYGLGYPALNTGAGDANTAFIIHIWAMGGSILGKNFRPTFATPANIKAFTELVTWVPKISAPGLYETDYNEENELFASGKVAHIIQWMPSAVSSLVDPKTSKVVGKVGFSKMYGASTRGGGWATGITTTSPHPQETFEFLKFMSSREMLREGLIRFSNGLVRKSLTQDKDLVQQLPWIPGTVQALETAQELPPLPEIPAIREVIGKETVRALKGEVTPEQALKSMDTKVYEILKKAGYYK